MTMVIAHRGGESAAAENSISAFQRAIASGVDMIEFDVRQTVDRQLVVFHDEKVAGRPVTQLTRQELEVATGRELPTLEAVAALAEGEVGLDVEIKEPGYELATVQSLAGFPRAGLIFTSFHREVVAALGTIEPLCPRGLIVGGRSWRGSLVSHALSVGATHLVVHRSLLRPGLLAEAREADLLVFVWTVNRKPELARLLADSRVQGVVTDLVELALEVRGQL